MVFEYLALADAIADVLRARKAGRAVAPERLAVPLPTGTLLCMPAADEAVAIVKNLTVHPGNRELPVIQGEVLVMDAATGRKLAVLDARDLTARRTAAVSLLAARRLASRPAGPVCVIGAGVQAEAHIEAFWQGLGARDIRLVSRTRSRAEALASRLADAGIAVRVLDAAGAAVADAALVVTATTSPEPVFPDVVPDDVFVAAVGSFTPEAAEVPATLVRRALLFVDDLASAKVEAGDFLRAGVEWEAVTPLEDVPDSAPIHSGPVVFKTVGHALFDLAAAKLACR